MAKSWIFVTEHIRNIHPYLCSDADNTSLLWTCLHQCSFLFINSLNIHSCLWHFFFFFKCWSYTSIPAIRSALINSTSDLFHFWYFICSHWWPYQIQVACFSLRSLSPCSFLNNNSAVSHPVFLSYCASNRSLDNSIYWVEVGFLK